MHDRKLSAMLSKLGFPMFEPSEELDVNKVLLDVVRTHDTRLWEGFPVLLANAAENYQFAPEQVEQKLGSQKHKRDFHRLMLLSGALFSFYHLSFLWLTKLQKGFSKEDRALVREWKQNLSRNEVLQFNDVELDPDRLKRVFELYFENKAEKEKRRKEKYAELSLEYALSQLLSPKQKDLFKKRLNGLPLSKTEQEYYSRTVKKKVVALANSELHSLSKKLLNL